MTETPVHTTIHCTECNAELSPTFYLEYKEKPYCRTCVYKVTETKERAPMPAPNSTQIANEILEKVKQGAAGNYTSAIEACHMILKEDYFGMVGFPDKPVHEKKTYAPRPGDKGFRMNAKKAGLCVTCNGPIAVGDSIYFKSGDGAKHEACVEKTTTATV